MSRSKSLSQILSMLENKTLKELIGLSDEYYVEFTKGDVVNYDRVDIKIEIDLRKLKINR